MAKAITRFSAKVERPPADEPDAATLEIIAAALKPGQGLPLSCSPDGVGGANLSPKKIAEYVHGRSKSGLMHAATAAIVPLPAPRPQPRRREIKK